MKRGIAISIIICCWLTSCRNIAQDETRANKKFLLQFGKSNFSRFKGWEFMVRGFDKGNPIILVYDRRTPKKSPCDLAFAVTVDAKTYRILQTNRTGIDDSCYIDEKTSSTLAAEFVKMDVFLVKVDSMENVEVSTAYHEGEQKKLIKSTSNPDFNKWTSLGDGWYEKKIIQ